MNLPDGIRARGNSLLIDVTVHGVRRTKTVKGLENLVEAVTVRDHLKQSLLDTLKGARLVTSDHDMSLQQAYDLACQDHWYAGKAGSWEKLRANGMFCVNHFGAGTNVKDITATHINAFTKFLRDGGLAGGTINRKVAALSLMLTVAQDAGKLDRRPKVMRQKESEGRIRFLTPEEEGMVLKVFETWAMPTEVDITTVLIDTGLRPSELWRLSPRDIDFTLGVIQLWKTKTHKPRAVPMTERVKAILERRVTITTSSSQHLFIYDSSKLSQKWRQMALRIGFHNEKDFVPYALRHTCATRLIQRGVSIRVVQEWMGHKSILTTRRYLQFHPKELLGAVKVLETSIPNDDVAASVA
ncbi:MAG: tyrosine-type recombinase/integrase [Cetobacterium sp.]